MSGRAATLAAPFARLSSSPLLLLFLLLCLPALSLEAQGNGNGNGNGTGSGGGGIAPMAGGGNQAYAVQVSPKKLMESYPDGTNDVVDQFTVKNSGTNAAEFDISCSHSGRVLNCSPDVPSVILDPSESQTVYVTYDVGSAATGILELTAEFVMDNSVDDSGTMEVVAPPSIVLEVPAGTGRAVVRNRQPVLRALFRADDGTSLDTTATVLTWRGDTVTALARHNRGLLEWEVDSLHWLRTGLPGFSGADSAEAVVSVCDSLGGCRTTSRWVVLPDDQAPVLGFTGMPLGTLNGGFSSGFGPGLGVSGAEVTTGFATPGYVSMG
jgi:hypothetical protein